MTKQRLAAAVMIVTLIYFLIRTVELAHRPQGFDLTSYLLSARALATGTDPYRTVAVFTYLYPLFLAAILVPLTFLPYSAAVVLWFGAACASMVQSVKKVLCWVGIRLDRVLWPDLLVWFLLVVFVIQNDLQNGQVNFIVLLLCVLFFDRLGDRAVWRPALLFSAAAAIKILPVLLILLPAARRQWRLVALGLIFSSAMVLVPVLFVTTDVAGYLARYAALVALHAGAGWEDTVARANFYSLAGVLAWILPASLPGAVTRVAGALVTVLVTVALDMRSRHRNPDHRSAYAFGLYMVALVLASPISEKHHLVLTFPALLLAWFDRPASRGVRRYRGRAVVVIFTGLFYTMKWAEGFPWAALALLMLYAQTARGLWRAANPGYGSSASSPRPSIQG